MLIVFVARVKKQGGILNNNNFSKKRKKRLLQMGPCGAQPFTPSQCSGFIAAGFNRKAPEIFKSNTEQRMQLCDPSLVVSRQPVYSITLHI